MPKPMPDELPSHENGAKSVNDSDDTPKNHDDDETTSAKSFTPEKAAAQPLPSLSKLL